MTRGIAINPMAFKNISNKTQNDCNLILGLLLNDQDHIKRYIYIKKE